MEQATEAPSEQHVESLFRKLRDFRETLNPAEQEQLDALAILGLGLDAETQAAGEGNGDGAVDPVEVLGFATRLKEFRDGLSEDEKMLLDPIVVSASGVEPETAASEVSGYRLAWTRWWDTSPWANPGPTLARNMWECNVRSGGTLQVIGQTWSGGHLYKLLGCYAP